MIYIDFLLDLKIIKSGLLVFKEILFALSQETIFFRSKFTFLFMSFRYLLLWRRLVSSKNDEYLNIELHCIDYLYEYIYILYICVRIKRRGLSTDP